MYMFIEYICLHIDLHVEKKCQKQHRSMLWIDAAIRDSRRKPTLSHAQERPGQKQNDLFYPSPPAMCGVQTHLHGINHSALVFNYKPQNKPDDLSVMTVSGIADGLVQ